MKRLKLSIVASEENHHPSNLFTILETDNFLSDYEEIINWIFITNIEVSEEFASKQVQKLDLEIDKTKFRISRYPESGLDDERGMGTKKFPLLEGRYSLHWQVHHYHQVIILLSLFDLRYPKEP